MNHKYKGIHPAVELTQIAYVICTRSSWVTLMCRIIGGGSRPSFFKIQTGGPIIWYTHPNFDVCHLADIRACTKYSASMFPLLTNEVTK